MNAFKITCSFRLFQISRYDKTYDISDILSDSNGDSLRAADIHLELCVLSYPQNFLHFFAHYDTHSYIRKMLEFTVLLGKGYKLRNEFLK